jgi:hypothetical protein
MRFREELPPLGVVWVALVACLMASFSFGLVWLPGPRVGAAGELASRLFWIVTCDEFAIQNLGHAAFLVSFATSYWRNRNWLGLSMCQTSSLYLFCSGLGYLLVWIHVWHDENLAHSILLFSFLFVTLGSLVTSHAMAGSRSIFRCVQVAQREQNVLPCLLLLVCFLECLEPLFVAWIRLHEFRESINSRQGYYSFTLSLRGFMESYTLGFHQAFVMAAAFSPIVSGENDASTILLAMFGQLAVALGLGRPDLGAKAPVACHERIVRAQRHGAATTAATDRMRQDGRGEAVGANGGEEDGPDGNRPYRIVGVRSIPDWAFSIIPLRRECRRYAGPVCG